MKKLQEAIDKKIANNDYELVWVSIDECFDFEILKGKILKNIEVTDDSIVFETVGEERYELCHKQDCCEEVYIESIVGDVLDLIGNPLLIAEAVNNDRPIGCEEYLNSSWTFYKLATVKGYVDIRWVGSSNGCYSEEAGLYKMVIKKRVTLTEDDHCCVGNQFV